MASEFEGNKIGVLFRKSAEIVEKALSDMCESVKEFCDSDDKDMCMLCESTIKLEKKQDRLSEYIVSRIFSNETMVFSRSDRLQLVEWMDTIVDEAEIVCRKIQIHKPAYHENISNHMIEMVTFIAEIGTHMKYLFIGLLEDFKSASKDIRRITDLRRDVREERWHITREIYASELNFKDFYFYMDLLRNLTHVADLCEHYADRTYALIVKYSL